MGFGKFSGARRRAFRILVPLDGSLVTEPVLTRMEQMAQCMNAEIVLLKVPTGIHETKPATPDDRADAQEVAQNYLTRIEADLGSRGVEVTSVIAEGDVRELIGEIAQEERIDFVALFGNGAGFDSLQRLFIRADKTDDQTII